MQPAWRGDIDNVDICALGDPVPIRRRFRPAIPACGVGYLLRVAAQQDLLFEGRYFEVAGDVPPSIRVGLAHKAIPYGGDAERPLVLLVWWHGLPLRGFLPSDPNPLAVAPRNWRCWTGTRILRSRWIRKWTPWRPPRDRPWNPGRGAGGRHGWRAPSPERRCRGCSSRRRHELSRVRCLGGESRCRRRTFLGEAMRLEGGR